MQEKCPVCKNNIKTTDKACSVCGFTDLHREFITKEDGELWIKQVVEPFRKQYENSKRKVSTLSENVTKKYNERGLDSSGYDAEGYNDKGFNKQGIHRNGSKFDRDGYDNTGYNEKGFNRQGIHRNGTSYNSKQNAKNTGKGLGVLFAIIGVIWIILSFALIGEFNLITVALCFPGGMLIIPLLEELNEKNK